MRSERRLWRFLALLGVLALIASACSGASDDTTTTAAPDAPVTTAGAETPTTMADTETTMGGTETTTGGAAAMDFGEPVTLTLGHPFPEQHPIHQNALVPYAEAVSEATGGAVTIEFNVGGSLAAAPATFENTAIGGQDMGWALQGYHAGVFPLTEIVEQPFQFSSAVQGTSTLWDLYDEFPALQDEYGDVAVLGLWVHDVGDLWTGDTEVQTLEDMEGLTLRFPTPVVGQLIEAMGGSSVGMPAPEIFDSLSTGVIDGLMIAVSGLESFGLYPELQYGTQCDCYVAAQYLVMNMDSWNELTPDTQAVMTELGREYSMVAAEVYDGLYDSVSVIAEEQGIVKYVLPEDELDRWHEVGQSVTDNWISSTGSPAQEMYDRMQEIKAEYSG